MILANGTVMTDTFEQMRCDIRIENEKIVELGENLQGGERMDMSGKTVLPGFIDTHIHGACGTRISDDNAALSRITRFEATQGVTGIAITTASSEFGDILRQIDAAAAVKKNEGTKILGIHAEGPFLCKKYKGAMNEEYIIAPQAALLDQMLEHAKGLLKIITVAPEAEGAEEFIRYAVEKGVKVCLYSDRITLGERVFLFAETGAVTVLGRNKLNIYFGERVYQLKGSKRFNALKYVNFYHHDQNQTEGKEDGEFLGL